MGTQKRCRDSYILWTYEPKNSLRTGTYLRAYLCTADGAHLDGLIGRHHLVFESLKEDDRAGELSREVDGGTGIVEICAFGVRADEGVEIARLVSAALTYHRH